MLPEADITIIGAGVVGLAIAAEVASKNKRIFVLEKNESFGLETSSRNSQVVHSGIYYPHGSLKAKTCVEGKTILYEFCKRHDLDHRRLGKLIVAVDDEETEQLQELLERGRKNGVDDLRLLSGQEAKEMEPNVTTAAAIFSPSTGIVDVYALMKCFIAQVKDNGGSIVYRSKVVSIDRKSNAYRVSVEDNNGGFRFATSVLINSAGLHSDKVAELAGIDIVQSAYKLHYCKGEYFRVSRDKSKLVERLIYPVPKMAGSGLGIHTTLTLDGVMLLGPSSHYVDSIDYSVDDQLKSIFFDSASKYLPFLEYEDLEPEMAGIRPTLQDTGDGFRDFVIKDERENGLPGFINLVGIESPGLTSSLAIAKYVGALVEEALKN